MLVVVGIYTRSATLISFYNSAHVTYFCNVVPRIKLTHC